MRRSIHVLLAAVALSLATAAPQATAAPGAAPAPRISLRVPGQVPSGGDVIARGSVRAAPAGSTVRVADSRYGSWHPLAHVALRGSRFRLSVPLPSGSGGSRLRAELVRGGRTLAKSPARWVLFAAPDPTVMPPGASTATIPAPAPAPAPVPTPTPPSEPTPEPEPEPIPEPPYYGPMYWGAWIEGAPWSWSPVTEFEKDAGKGVSLLEFSTPWEECPSGERDSSCYRNAFPAEQFDQIRGHGAIPFFSWGSQWGPAQPTEPEYELEDIADGSHDAYIEEWAKAAAKWGHPFFLRFDWEMNGNWFNWGTNHNGNLAPDFVAAWDHVRQVFREVGANNATWVWCPFVNPNGSPNIADPAAFYPGDSEVDWTCLDGYNWGAAEGRKWHTFSYWFEKSYRRVREIAPTKPMVLGEIGSNEAGGSKAAWLEEMFSLLPTEFPAVRALVYANFVDRVYDWPIESSEAARQAFAAGVADPRYRANTLGGLATSPIPVP